MVKQTIDRCQLSGSEIHLENFVPGRIPLGIVYPNSYRVGMASLGYQIVRQIAAMNGDFDVQRFFANLICPSRKLPISIESGMSFRDVDILAFTLTYELDYFNIAKMLASSGINPYRERRSAGDPLIILGGIVPTANPLPASPIADAIFIGEAEAGWAEVLSVLSRMRGAPKSDILIELTNIPSLYIPALDDISTGESKTATAVKIDPLPDYSASSHIVTSNAEFGSTILIEPVRGCPYNCAFCLIGTMQKPVRVRDIDVMLQKAEQAKAAGIAKVGLLGSAVGAHPNSDELFTALLNMDMLISVSSLSTRDASPEILRALAKSGQRSVTFSPETVSPNLKQTIRKNVDDAELEQAIQMSQAAGISRIKLYYIIGIPGEEDADATAIAESVTSLCTKYPGLRFDVSVNPVIAKLGTAFEEVPLIPQKDYRRRVKLIRKATSGNVSLSAMSWKEADTQRKISVGDENTLEDLIKS